MDRIPIVVRVDSSLKDELLSIAKVEHRTLTKQCEMFLERALRQYSREHHAKHQPSATA